jgi:uncharacterized lipoprotein YajG
VLLTTNKPTVEKIKIPNCPQNQKNMNTKLLLRSFIIILLFAAGCQKTQSAKTTPSIAPTPPTSSISSYGTFSIQNAFSGDYAEVSGVTDLGTKLLNGTALQQNALSLSNSKTNRWQEWQFSLQSNGYYTIMNLNSGIYGCTR